MMVGGGPKQGESPPPSSTAAKGAKTAGRIGSSIAQRFNGTIGFWYQNSTPCTQSFPHPVDTESS